MIKKKLSLSIFLSTFVLCSYMVTKNVYAASTKRLGGKNRYETAVSISKEGWNTSNYAVLATGSDYPDALCATPLAKMKDAPIILTEKNNLDSNTEQELIRLGVKEIYIIGGNGVISESVENKLKSMGINCVRIGGKDRYETSVKVAEKIGTSNEVVLATGANFPDALSIAPIAAKKGIPILLSSQNVLPSTVSNYLKGKTISNSYLIGGTGVLSDNVKSSVPNAKRLGGKDRYDTNIRIIQEFEKELNFSSVYMATGVNFPDALSGSALAPKYNAPIVLTSNTIPNITKNYIETKFIDEIDLLGGIGVISTSTEEIAKNLPNGVINFSDINLKEAVRLAINKPTGDIYKSDVKNITELRRPIEFNQIEIIENGRSSNKITSLSGIEYLTNLEVLDLKNNEIVDIMPLKNLTKLRELNLQNPSYKNNRIVDISPLKNLTNLEYLYLGGNKISYITPLQSLTKLKYLDLGGNGLTNITSLKNLTNLEYLCLGLNRINDVTPLKNLIKLKDLYLELTDVSDANIKVLKQSLPNCNIRK